MATQEEIIDENRRVRRLQIVVDLVMSVLRQSEIPFQEAAQLVAQTRAYALSLFPDKEATYELLYQSKFRRLMTEKYGMV